MFQRINAVRRVAFARRVFRRHTVVAFAVFGALYLLSRTWKYNGVTEVSGENEAGSLATHGPAKGQRMRKTVSTREEAQLAEYEPDFVHNTTRYLTISPAPHTIRLCNRIFRLASAYGLARQSGRILLMHNAAEEANLGLLSEVFDFGAADSAPVREKHVIMDSARHNLAWTTIGERWPCAHDVSLRDRLVQLVQADVELNGYLQSYRYFHRYSSSIRTLFVFKEDVLAAARRYFEAIRVAIKTVKKVVFVGMHIRRGDLDAAYMRARGYRTADMTYLYNAMSHFIKQFASGDVHVAFVVCSDTLNWFQSQFSADELKKLLGSADSAPFSVHYPSVDGPTILKDTPGHANQHFDFTVLSRCNHSIITVGSYGFWTAYFAGGITVYYRAQFYPNTDISIEFNQSTADYYLPDWIPMAGAETDWIASRNLPLSKNTTQSP